MAVERKRRAGWIEVLGGLCLVGTLVSTSFVQAVRAEDPEAPLMSIDPGLADPAAPAAAPAVAPPEAAQPPRIIQLNTRGYNYGPAPREVDPAAIRFEGGPAPSVPSPR